MEIKLMLTYDKAMKQVLIYETYQSIKADQVEALLKSNNIAYEIKALGAGSYLKLSAGFSATSNIQIYVNEEDAEKASEMIQAIGL